MILEVAAAAVVLRGGEVVAYPTETVYGLGVDATSSAALERLARLKGRTPESGLSVLVPDLAGLEALAPALPAAARRLAERFWPGPLTLVVPTAAPALAALRTAHGVGFRCSPHPTARALVRALGRPLVSTSCNRTGEPPCLEAAEVARCFGESLAVAGGEPAGGLPPSSVVAVSLRGELHLLREGPLSRTEIWRETRA